jgi:hypothetical protein
MNYRLLFRSKRNRIEFTERIITTLSASNALEYAQHIYFQWTLIGIEVWNG